MLQCLPNHVFVKICDNLCYQDLESLALSCSKLESLVHQPAVWTRFEVPQSWILSDVSKFVADSRFKCLRTVDIRKEKKTALSTQELNLLFQYFRKNRSIKRLRLENIDLHDVPGFPLASSILHIPILILDNCHLTAEQLTCFFRELNMCEALTTLSLSGNNLEFVPSHFFTQLPNNCYSLNLSLTDLKTDQITGLLSNIHPESSVLKELDLSDLDLSNIDDLCLQTAFTTLESVKMSNAILTEEGKKTIFSFLSSNQHHLKHLDLSGVSLSDLDENLLARVLKNINNVVLSNTWLSLAQFLAIIESLSDETLIKDLDVCGNSLLNEVTCENLLEGSLYLNTLNVASCHISTEVLLEFIQVQNSEDSKFKLVLFEGDYRDKQMKKILQASSCIQLNKTELPLYFDENSCQYYEEKAGPILLDESCRLER
eukprot:TRINITY_DN2655_c0_g1_i19.p1 TRINITY_DN2655_c0_g1~~TRINITY_DN2655_c0_g1_i19.p1  ORF type:complete len:429 (-),score=54.39 TRINITY_DN2655_c0_g1_i19:543-1829(-)